MTNHILKKMGQTILDGGTFIGSVTLLAYQVVKELMTPPHYPKLIIDQIHQIGNRSITLVTVTAASTGMVMALQFGFGLEKFGGKLYVPKIIALSIVRELGPVFASLMIAARVGAGITSEIGSMTVTQQIDAIRALGTSPIKRIVIPRVIATLVSLPILTIFANSIGIIGSLIVGYYELGLDPNYFFLKVINTTHITDYAVGLAKTFFFALIVSLTACHYGLNVSGGTRGVGTSTTKSVVTSSILILVSDFFLTKLFWIFEKWTS